MLHHCRACLPYVETSSEDRKTHRDMRQASDAALDAATEANNVSRDASLIVSNRAWIHAPEITVGFQGLAFFPESQPSIEVCRINQHKYYQRRQRTRNLS